MRRVTERQGTPRLSSDVADANYTSGDDYVVEFLGYRFAFAAADFEERVTAAAVKLGLLDDNELEEDETADLVELAADGRIAEPRSALGRYLVRHWERVSLVGGESLVYWLRKLVFRGAWLDHRVKEGMLEVAWDDDGRRLRLPRPERRPRPARARAGALVARARVQAVTPRAAGTVPRSRSPASRRSSRRCCGPTGTSASAARSCSGSSRV